MTLAQNRALQELWPEFGLDFARQRIDLNQAFETSLDQRTVDRPSTVLEIGFGMGDSLFESARAFPDTNYLGIEVHGPGVGHLLQLAARAGLGNLRVYRHDVIEVMQYCIPEACLDVVQVFFPDPWPKKRHHKRRLVNSEFIELVSHKLKQGGVLHLATDWPSYAEQIRDVIAGSALFDIRMQGRERPETKYESRARRLGHSIVDLVYERR